VAIAADDLHGWMLAQPIRGTGRRPVRQDVDDC
jgi:hypothetical protein